MPALAGRRDHSRSLSSLPPQSAGRITGQRRTRVGVSRCAESVARQPAGAPALLDSDPGRWGTAGFGDCGFRPRSRAAGAAAPTDAAHRGGGIAPAEPAARMHATEVSRAPFPRNRAGSRHSDDRRRGLCSSRREETKRTAQRLNTLWPAAERSVDDNPPIREPFATRGGTAAVP